MTTRKKTTAKAKAANANAEAKAPKGFETIGGSYAKTWTPQQVGDEITFRTAGDVRTVEFKMGRKKQERLCVEIETDEGARFTLWESAALSGLFDRIKSEEVGQSRYWVCYTGLGKPKANQQPPKLFEVAVAA